MTHVLTAINKKSNKCEFTIRLSEKEVHRILESLIRRQITQDWDPALEQDLIVMLDKR